VGDGSGNQTHVAAMSFSMSSLVGVVMGLTARDAPPNRVARSEEGLEANPWNGPNPVTTTRAGATC
jgi:hypothetical protein